MKSANRRRHPANRSTGLACTIAVLLALAGSACGGPDPATSAAVDVPEMPASLAEAPADLPHLTVRLLEVMRVGDGVIGVRFSVSCAADAPGPVPIAGLFASAPADAGTVADVFAVDEASGKKYFVVRDAEGHPVGSRDVDPIAPGASRELWTRLGAPLDATVVTIQVPHVPPFAGVPIAGPQADDRQPREEPLPRTDRM